MKIGIIAEGHSDRIIIQCLLKLLRGIDSSQIQPIRPVDSNDETTLHEAMKFSNWTIVLEECSNAETFENFFDVVDEERYLVVQIDTAECTDAGYDVTRPERSGKVDWQLYSIQLRDAVVSKLQSLIPEKYHDKMLYAVCIEETDAWLIPIWDKVKQDTAQSARPKEKLAHIISGLNKKEKYIDTEKKNLNYEAIGKELRGKKAFPACKAGNKSLQLFCDSVETQIPDLRYIQQPNK